MGCGGAEDGGRFLARVALSPTSQRRRWENFSQLPRGRGPQLGQEGASLEASFPGPLSAVEAGSSSRQFLLRPGADPLPFMPQVSTADSAGGGGLGDLNPRVYPTDPACTPFTQFHRPPTNSPQTDS